MFCSQQLPLRLPVAVCLLLCTFLVREGHTSTDMHQHDLDGRGAARLGASFLHSDLSALMSMISGFTSGSDPSWNLNTFTCDWVGVTCNATGYVTYVGWGNRNLVGVLNLTVVPQYVQIMQFQANALTGPVLDWSSLPPTLTEFYLDNNQFNGSVDFEHLPPALVALELSYNQFSGTPNLAVLPPALQALDLSHNQFSGTPNLTALPPAMFQLDLSYNQFSGTPSFTSLPPQTRILVDVNLFCSNMYVSNIAALQWGNMCIGGTTPAWDPTTGILSCPACSPNPHEEDLVAMLSLVSGLESGWNPTWTAANPACAWAGVTCTNTIVTEILFDQLSLSGTLNMTLLPRYAQTFAVQSNAASNGTAVIGWSALSSCSLVALQLNNNGFIGDLNAMHLPATLQFFDVSGNSFTGSPDLSLVPGLRQLYIPHNAFCGIIKATNATFIADNVDGLCYGGIDATWVPEVPAYVCPSCSGGM